MDIDRKLLEHVADVARLKLTDEEINEFIPQLKEVMKAFSEISKVDTDGIEPSYHPIKIEGMARADEPKESLSNEDALSNTKHKKDGYFEGPALE